MLQWPRLWSCKASSSTDPDDYQESNLHTSHNWKCNDVQFYWLWVIMPLLTVGVSRYWQQWIRYLALYGHPMYVIWFIDRRLPWYGYIHIQLHATSDFCCFQSCGRFFNVHPGSYVWWLHCQRHGDLTCLCAGVVCRELRYLSKWSPISRYAIHCYLVAVVECPWCPGGVLYRKIITRGRWKPWRLYSWVCVKMK